LQFVITSLTNQYVPVNISKYCNVFAEGQSLTNCEPALAFFDFDLCFWVWNCVAILSDQCMHTTQRQCHAFTQSFINTGPGLWIA